MMKSIASVVGVLVIAGPISAHRLNEYLQATILSVEKDHVPLSMRLVPGTAVAATVIAGIDSNSDGILSKAEQRAYAASVLRDLALTVDGNRLSLRLISVDFPKPAEIREGLGQIQIEFSAELPSGGANRRLVFENHHQSKIAAYLVNCLVPRDKDIHIISQNRNQLQSFYQLDYVDAGAPSGPGSFLIAGGAVRFWFHGFAGMFRLGMRHIAEGTDHLLFLLALLLPAPLLVFGARWAGFAGVRHSLLQILKVVSAFTVGHSLTLALAAFGLVHVPVHPVEVLIAVSILVSAAHAIYPLFPGREAAIAAFFGLIHGLAFASTLGQLGLTQSERVVGILGFNLGIEAMQLVVVAATMPSLILLSRTRGYAVLRIGGALFAGFASVGWIAERLLNVINPVDAVVDVIARYAVWIAVFLLLISLASWSLRSAADKGVGASETSN
jgi:hypothetical protein